MVMFRRRPLDPQEEALAVAASIRFIVRRARRVLDEHRHLVVPTGGVIVGDEVRFDLYRATQVMVRE